MHKTRAVLVFVFRSLLAITDQGELKCTSDKIVVKHISVKETLLKLDLEPKGQFHSKQQNNKQGNKNIPPLDEQSKTLLGNKGQALSG